MTRHDILTLLNALPTYSEPAEGLAAADRSWLCDFRLQIATHHAPTAADEERLARIAKEWDTSGVLAFTRGH